jgi:hypothetical protein
MTKWYMRRAWEAQQMNKREQLAAMRVEDFKEHLRTIVGEDPKREITGAPRPHPSLVRDAKRAKPQQHGRRKRRTSRS